MRFADHFGYILDFEYMSKAYDRSNDRKIFIHNRERNQLFQLLIVDAHTKILDPIFSLIIICKQKLIQN